MFRSPYFRRLFMPMTALVCACTLASALHAAVQLRAAVLQQAITSMEHTAGIIANLASRFSGTALQDAISAIAVQQDAAITVIDVDGCVLLDSDGARPGAAVGQALEIMQARRDGHATIKRMSHEHDREMFFRAVRLPLTPDTTCIVRVGLAAEPLEATVRRWYWRLFGGTCVALAVACGCCYLFAWRRSRAVMRLADGARALARGTPPPDEDIDEPGEIGVAATAINEAAASMSRLIRRTRQDREELGAALGSMVEGVIAVDGQLNVSFANEAAGRLLDFDAEHARGQPLDALITLTDILVGVQRVARRGKTRRLRLGPTSTALELAVSICPVKGRSRPRGYVIVCHDASESQRYQELRTEFVANASHELRTPLSLIRGFVETLQDGAKNDVKKRDRFLERIERNAIQLTNLISDLLEISELEEKRTSREHGAVDVGVLLERVCETLRPAAQMKDHKLKLTYPANLPAITGHSRDIERSFANLLDNAIKYTERGGWITVSAVRQDDDIVVAFEDTGLGIPEEDLPRIFERFFRVDKSRSKEMGGTGLGLAIVKHVVQAHGGVIDVTSKPGQGSRFTLELPIRNRPRPGAAAS